MAKDGGPPAVGWGRKGSYVDPRLVYQEVCFVVDKEVSLTVEDCREELYACHGKGEIKAC